MRGAKRIFVVGLLLLVALATPARAQGGKTQLEIGYMPILPVSQLFVALEKGWLQKAGIEPKLVQFQNGPAMVQAILAGQLDVAHFGIGPAMVARAKGAKIKVVAASIVEQISFIGLKDLAPYFRKDPRTAFARFHKDKGRKAVITTFPKGSVPYTVLQHWLRKVLKIDTSDVKIIYQGAAQVQQALLTGAVDGAAILEPIVTTVLERRKDAKVVARGSQMFEGQPGAILAVRESLIKTRPDLVKVLVRAQAKATKVLNDNPAVAAKAVQKYVGGGRLPLKTVEAAIRASHGTFVADPRKIISGTRAMRDFQAETGTLKTNVDIDKLFDTRFFKDLKQ